jgi:hypothetical protein
VLPRSVAFGSGESFYSGARVSPPLLSDNTRIA